MKSYARPILPTLSTVNLEKPPWGFQSNVKMNKLFSRSFSSLIPLHGKHYIEVKGPDTRKFLQGLISNDIYSLTTDKPIMTALLLAPKV
jgi:glycine cleavage system aminomethyltransferase T